MSVRMWGYYWGYSAAQVQLLVADTPIVTYKKDKSNKPKRPKMIDILKADAAAKNMNKEKVVIKLDNHQLEQL